MSPCFSVFQHLRPRLLLSSITLCLASSLSAQTISNPSFEADTFGTFPGYASGNGGAITGWTSTNYTRVGLNPAGGSPFADNGTIPNGSKVAFLQNAADADLMTTITGLTASTIYRVDFRSNARGGNTPNLKISINGAAVNASLDFAPPVADVGGNSVNSSNPYHYISFTFAAAGTTAALRLLNDAGGDNTVCVDDFSISLATATPVTGIVGTRWTGDADAGIDSSYRYTHAHTFGGGAINTTVNGVLFTPSPGSNAGNAGSDHMVVSGLGNAFGDQTRTPTGGSNNLGKSFIYGGPTMGIQIKGLKPNTTYVATVYGIGWENGTRSADFSGTAGGGPSNVNLDSYGVTNGITVRYRYTTDGSGSAITLNYAQAAGAGSFHTAGFSNREASPGTTANTWSIAPWNNDATSGINDGASYQYTHAINLNSSANPVINGVTFTGKTGGNPSGANFALTGFPQTFGGDTNNVTDAPGSRSLATDFLYNGFPGAINLSGLTAGTEYQLTLFTVGWEAAGSGRVHNFIGYNQTGAVYDQDAYGDNNGARVSYVYTAPASGTITVTTNPLNGGSLHLYGFANRKTAPETALAFTSHPQPVYVTAVGATATFSASASGSLPLTYQWRKNGTAIPGQSGTTNLTTTLTITGVTAADVADYSVAITGNGGQGTIISNAAHLTLITDPVPGLFNTGVSSNCALLPDGGADPHYLLLVNPDGDSLIPAIVEDSNAFPIVTGPWIANSGTSKWVGPRFNTLAAAGQAFDGGAGPGTYVYHTTFDLTGFTLSSVRISGKWTSDNGGVAIKVNDVATGIVGAGNFPSLENFMLTSANTTFVAGVNTIDFYVSNADADRGYTGLRVEDLQGFGTIPAATAPYVAVPPTDTTVARNASTCLSVSASGSATLTYQWSINGSPISGATSSTLAITADAYSKAGNYTVSVTNGTSSVISAPGLLTITDANPVAFTDAATTPKNTAITISNLTSNDTDAEGDTITITGVTAGVGGTVSLSGGVATFTPTTGFSGAASFTYAVSDGWGGTATGTVNVTVLNDLPPTFSGYTFGTPKNIAASVGVAKILVNAADPDGGTPVVSAAASTSAQGGTISLAGSSITYTPPLSFTGLDTFTITISDGQGASITGTITANVSAGSGASQNQALMTIQPGGNVAVLFMGIPGLTYQIQRSTDLVTWTTLSTQAAAADGTLPYLDTAPPGGSAFYRTKAP